MILDDAAEIAPAFAMQDRPPAGETAFPDENQLVHLRVVGPSMIGMPRSVLT